MSWIAAAATTNRDLWQPRVQRSSEELSDLRRKRRAGENTRNEPEWKNQVNPENN